MFFTEEDSFKKISKMKDDKSRMISKISKRSRGIVISGKHKHLFAPEKRGPIEPLLVGVWNSEVIVCRDARTNDYLLLGKI